MHIKNNLLNKDLSDRIHDRSIQILVELSAVPCQGRWPKCRISLNDKVKFDGDAKDSFIVEIEEHVSDSEVEFKIEIYGKTANDTVVDNKGKIIENMELHISKCKINGANIIDNGYINRGKYRMELDQGKKKHYVKNNFPIENNDHHFYENGVWSINLPIPVLKGIIEKVRTLETYETVSYQDIIKEIYKRIS